MHQLFAHKAKALGLDAKEDDQHLDALAREVCISAALTGNDDK